MNEEFCEELDGLTVRKAARLLGKSEQTVRSYRIGRLPVPEKVMKKARRIADALNAIEYDDEK